MNSMAAVTIHSDFGAQENSFSIFIISFLNSVSMRVKRSVSLFFQGNFLGILTMSGSSSLHFTYFLLLCEFRRNNYYCDLGGLFFV